MMKNQLPIIMIMALLARNATGFLQTMNLLNSKSPNIRLNQAIKYRHQQQFGVKIKSSCDPLISKSPKTRRRLIPLVELTSKEAKVVADIGCDHGLLSRALAKKDKKRQVIGTDISLEALQQGAFQLPQLENLSFREGPGLEPLLKESMAVDTVCIAGMGVNTMMNEILLKQKAILKQIDCRQLVLQPTNNRPRNLVQIYQHLLQNFWQVEKENMVYLSKRWYLTTSFVRCSSSPLSAVKGDDNVWPGDVLWHSSQNSPEQRMLYQQYAQHHVIWLKHDLKERGGQQERFLNPLDLQWLQEIRKANVLKSTFFYGLL